MSEYLTAAAAALNTPEAIVMRSAAARAAAAGTSTEEVLKAWAGGGSVGSVGSVAATSALPPAAAPAPAAAPVPATTSVAEPVPPRPPSAPLVAAPAAVPEPEPEEAAPLRERVRVAGRYGAWTGSLLGLIGLLGSSVWLMPRATVVGEAGSYQAAVEVTPGRFILAATLISVVFGVTVALVSRRLTGWSGPGMALRGGTGGTVGIGVLCGIVLGVIGSATLTGAFSVPVIEGVVAFPIISSVVVVLIGGAVLGWLTAALVQAVGIPEGVVGTEAEELGTVRHRLSSAILIPVTGAALLALFVLPFAFALIKFHLAAPVIAIIAAGGVLAFAGLSAARPGMRISFGEFLVAAAGVGVLVLVIAAVLIARDQGEAESGEASTETTVVQEEGTETTETTAATTGTETTVVQEEGTETAATTGTETTETTGTTAAGS